MYHKTMTKRLREVGACRKPELVLSEKIIISTRKWKHLSWHCTKNISIKVQITRDVMINYQECIRGKCGCEVPNQYEHTNSLGETDNYRIINNLKQAQRIGFAVRRFVRFELYALVLFSNNNDCNNVKGRSRSVRAWTLSMQIAVRTLIDGDTPTLQMWRASWCKVEHYNTPRVTEWHVPVG